MNRVTRKHTWEQHISSEQLMQELGLDAIDFYTIARWQLRWLGHVSPDGFGALTDRYRGACCCLRGRHTRGRRARPAAYLRP